MYITNSIEGKVFITFAVEEDGSLTDIKVVRGIGYGCDEEAIRIIKMMPKWIPGRDYLGNIIGTYYLIPIKFEFKQ